MANGTVKFPIAVSSSRLSKVVTLRNPISVSAVVITASALRYTPMRNESAVASPVFATVSVTSIVWPAWTTVVALTTRLGLN